MDSTAYTVLLILFFIALGFGIFLLIRVLVLWYYKIDERVNNQRQIISLLTSIKDSLAKPSTEKQPVKIEPGKVEN